MATRTRIRRLFDRKPRTVRKAPARRPTLETLEDRLAPAGFGLGALTNYGLLYEGNGGKSLAFNNGSSETGDIGIGGTGKFVGSNPATITGNVNFSAANTGQFSLGGVTLNGAVNYNVSAVASALATVNALSKTLGLEAGTATTIKSGGSITAHSGKQDANGNWVFTVTAVTGLQKPNLYLALKQPMTESA